MGHAPLANIQHAHSCMHVAIQMVHSALGALNMTGGTLLWLDVKHLKEHPPPVLALL